MASPAVLRASRFLFSSRRSLASVAARASSDTPKLSRLPSSRPSLRPPLDPPSSPRRRRHPPRSLLPPPRSLKDAIESSSEGGESIDAELSSSTPSKEALELFRRSEVIAFDIDCTVTTDDSLDMLARFLGKGDAIARLTSQAMNGEISLEEALTKRLDSLDLSPDDLVRFHDAFPAKERLTPGAKELISQLMERGKKVYLISGGFRELALPVARELGVPAENLFANRMNFQLRDGGGRRRKSGGDGGDDQIGVGEDEGSDEEEWGTQLRVASFDPKEEVSRNGGKPRAIQRIRASLPYTLVTMVGDGITDAEAASVAGGADLFVGFGGVVRRPAVVAASQWYVSSFAELAARLPGRRRVAMIGSGAWACAAAKVVASNLPKLKDFEDDMAMWVFEEEVEWPRRDGAAAPATEKRKLSELVNELNENVKYLPGVKLGKNVRADPDLASAVRGADVLLFCVPHQHVSRVVRELVGVVGKGDDAASRDAVALSLIKGMRIRKDGPQLISSMISRVLGIETGVLCGANIAEEVASERGTTEATIASPSAATTDLFLRLFTTDNFNVRASSDRVGVEMAGTLKNVVALAVGLSTGLDAGWNAKGALLRAGIGEMLSFASSVVAPESGGGSSVQAATMLEACGIADVVASSFGGRNARVAAEYARRVTAGTMPPGRATVDALEAELLAGQSLQGELTSRECSEAIELKFGRVEGLERFPLFGTVRAIMDGKLAPEQILRYRAAASELSREAASERRAAAEGSEGEVEGGRRAREPAGV